MPQMSMVDVKYVKSLDHLKIDEIVVFVDFTHRTFNIANASRWFSGVHWQQTLQIGLVQSLYTKAS